MKVSTKRMSGERKKIENNYILLDVNIKCFLPDWLLINNSRVIQDPQLIWEILKVFLLEENKTKHSLSRLANTSINAHHIKKDFIF